MTAEGACVPAPGKQDSGGQEQKRSSSKAMDTIMSSLARKRRTSGVFGSKRWWTPSCWASRSQQEAYLRKLYSKKYSNGIANPAVCTADELQQQPSAESGTWKPPGYELPATDEHYLDAFLRARPENECPALSTPRASPTEKCVEFLSRNEARSRECIVDVHQDQQQQLHPQGQAAAPLRVTEHNFDEILRNASGSAPAE